MKWSVMLCMLKSVPWVLSYTTLTILFSMQGLSSA
ncbi:hypothetical protein BMETH_1103_1 [methanotrophic bacterial endosymbiont of Bathymodiolus sp.]|nr:hypothetical protein BMETH_1103_1 [methanotrophic bacterial endosymbiont of Bathymodiolus sp.]